MFGIVQAPLGTPTLGGGASTPAETYEQAVNTLGPLAYWPLDPNRGAGLLDVQSLQGLTIGSGSVATVPLTVIDGNAGGQSLYFSPDSPPSRLEAVHNAAWYLDEVTVIVHAVVMDVSGKSVLFTRASGIEEGSWGLEVEAGGVPRLYYITTAGNVVNLRGSAADIITGRSFALALAVGGGTANGYVLSTGETLITLSATAATVNAFFLGAIAIGSYYGGQGPANGIISHAMIFDSKLTQEQIETVLAPQNITYAPPVDAGEITEDAATDIDVSERAIYLGSATAAVEGQMANSTLSAPGGAIIRITAGTTAGADAGMFSINGSAAAAISADVVSATINPPVWHGGQWIGNLSGASTAGNAPHPGVGYNSNQVAWAYRIKAPYTETLTKLRFNLPRRPGYYLGTGGSVQVTIRSDDGSGDPDMTAPGIIWQSGVFALSVNGAGTIQYPAGLVAFYGLGGDEGAEISINAAVTANQTFHVVWTNAAANPVANCFTINHGYNESFGDIDIHPMPLYAEARARRMNAAGTWSYFGRAQRHQPYYMLQGDQGWWGQGACLGGTTSRISTIAGGADLQGSTREIGGTWQIGQLWTHTRGDLDVNSFRARLWRRTSSTTYPLRVQINRLTSTPATIVDVTIAAGSVFQTTYDNQSGGATFPWVSVSLGGDVTLEEGEQYRLVLSTSNAATIYAMRAVWVGSKATICRDECSWPTGYAQYSTNSGSSWTGMHIWGSDNQTTLDWNMLLCSV